MGSMQIKTIEEVKCRGSIKGEKLSVHIILGIEIWARSHMCINHLARGQSRQ